MRSKIHKAISKDNGLWYEGYYVRRDDTTYCLTEDYDRAKTDGKDPRHHYLYFDETTDWGLPNNHRKVEIKIDTLCECTSLRDKNNILIFENDIVKDSEENIGIIKFQDKWIVKWRDSHYRQDLVFWSENKLIEVVGNIYNYDNEVKK